MKSGLVAGLVKVQNRAHRSGDIAAPHPPDTQRGQMGTHQAAVWAIGAQYLSFGIQFAASVIISRFFLAPEEVGLFSIALAISLLVAVLNDFGLTRYIAALPQLDDQTVQRCFTVSVLLSLAVAGLTAASAHPVALIYATPALVPLLLCIAASYLFQPLSIVPLAIMARGMRFRGHFCVIVIGALAQAMTAIGLAWAGWSAMSLAVAAIALTFSRGVTALALQPLPRWPLRWTGLHSIAQFGGKSSLLALSGAVGTRSTDLIVGKILTFYATGLFSRASGLAEQIRMIIGGAIGAVFFPAFARIRDRGEPLGPAYLRVCAGYTACIWPGMAGLALAAEPVVHLLYGPVWSETAPLLTLIALHCCIVTVLPLVAELPILLGRINRLLLLNVLDTALSISLLAIGCLWGVEGAAASRIVYAAAWVALYYSFMHGLIDFDQRAWLWLSLRSFIASLAALAPLALCYAFYEGPAVIGIGPLALCIVAGAIFWLAALVLLRHPALSDLAKMLGTLLPAPVAQIIRRRLGDCS